MNFASSFLQCYISDVSFALSLVLALFSDNVQTGNSPCSAEFLFQREKTLVIFCFLPLVIELLQNGIYS